MRDFFRYAKNRFLYNLLKIAIVLGLGLIASQFLFIQKVSAETYQSTDFTAQLYDNNGGALTAVTTSGATGYWYGSVGFIANSSGAAWGFSSPISIVKGHTYSLTLNIGTSAQTAGIITFSSVNRIGLGSSLSNAVSSYQNATNTELIYTNLSNDRLQFVFKANSNGSYLVVPFCTTYSINSETVYFNSFVINDLGSSTDISQDDINSSLSSQTNELNNSINNSTNTITSAIDDTENSINSNIDDMESAIVDSNKETQEVIKDQFNSCRDSYNLLNNVASTQTINGVTFTVNEDKSVTIKGTATAKTSLILATDITLSAGTYYLKGVTGGGSLTYAFTLTGAVSLYNGSRSFTVAEEKTYSNAFIYVTSGVSVDTTIYPMIVSEENKDIDYEPYGKQVCSNKLDEANETSKGIWATIKDLPNQFLNMLKGLFIPDDDYFSNWYTDFKEYIELKLGFLATPFTIFLDFIETYLDLSSSDDIVISIPDVTVPNFEDHTIISATTFNWSELLRSKSSLNNLWQLYLDFIDVYLILNFLSLCERTYNRIFGGDTSNYEYYTVEDSYTYDSDTGEVLSARRNERTTQKRKVEK